MSRENNSEFLHNDEYLPNDEQFFHADEFNKDAEIGLNKRDSFEGGDADAATAVAHKVKKDRKMLLGKTAVSLKTGAITVAVAVAVCASPAALMLGFEKPPLLPDSNTEETQAAVQHIHDTQGGWFTAISPSCSAEGLVTLKCESCGETLETKPLPQLQHSPEDWKTIKVSNCTENGTEVQNCRYCGKQLDSRETQPLGHSESGWITLINATCTTDGTRYTLCTACGERLKTQTVAATGHTAGTWTIVNCSSCISEGKQAIFCTSCGIELDSLPLAMSEHSESGWIVDLAKTCTTEGHQHTQCTNCGKTLNEKTIPASHNEITEPAVEATCTTDGHTIRIYCADCGTEIVNTQIIPATGHTRQVVAGYAATCTADGRTDGVICANCDLVFEEQTVINALGHDWTYDATVNLPANHYCSVCYVAADHVWINNADDERTHICSDCDSVQSHNFLIYNADASVTQRESCPDCGTLNPNY